MSRFPEMTKRERVRAALQGAEVDRVPVGFWGHDFLREWSVEGLVEATLERYRRFDWDFIKVNPRACYHVEDWGSRFKPSGDPNLGPSLVACPVKEPQDWRKIGRLDPYQGTLGEHLRALRLLSETLKGEASFVQTVFTPLSLTQNLAGDPERVKQHMQEAPEALHEALSAITETFQRFARACLEAGASGIFLATTVWATRDMLSDEAYEEFGRPYDLKVLEAVQGAAFNILHVCRGNNMLDLLRDYPVQAVNWAATLPTNPSLEEGHRMMGKAVMGGISEKTTLPEGPAPAVAQEATAALTEMQGCWFLLAPGCSIPPATPATHLQAASDAVRTWNR